MLLTLFALPLAKEGCRWKQTGGCSPSGRREPQLDRPCNGMVPAGASGYCVCSDGTRAAESGCSHKSFRCRDKCSAPRAGASNEERPAGQRNDAPPPRETHKSAPAASADEDAAGTAGGSAN